MGQVGGVGGALVGRSEWAGGVRWVRQASGRGRRSDDVSMVLHTLPTNPDSH